MCSASEVSDIMIAGLVKKGEPYPYKWRCLNIPKNVELCGNNLSPGDEWCDVDIILSNIDEETDTYWNSIKQSISKEYQYFCLPCHLSVLRTTFEYFRSNTFIRKFKGYRKRIYLLELDPAAIYHLIQLAYTKKMELLMKPANDVTMHVVLRASVCADFLLNHNLHHQLLKNCASALLTNDDGSVRSVRYFLRNNALRKYYNFLGFSKIYKPYYKISLVTPFMKIISNYIVRDLCISIMNSFNKEKYPYLQISHETAFTRYILLRFLECFKGEYKDWATIIYLTCMLDGITFHIRKMKDSDLSNHKLPECLSDVLFWNNTEIEIFALCYEIQVSINRNYIDNVHKLWCPCLITMIMWARPQIDEQIEESLEKLRHVQKIVSSLNVDLKCTKINFFDVFVENLTNSIASAKKDEIYSCFEIFKTIV